MTIELTELEDIKKESYEAWQGKRVWALVEETDGSYSVHVHTPQSVHPSISKADKRTAAARLLQMLDVGPIAPQYYPERVCIGSIEYDSADVLSFPTPSK